MATTKQILVVDDEPFMLRLIQFHLERAGYELLKARNGIEALSAARRHLPSLIVMDVMMAEMDGLTALRYLKSDPATQAIPVIIMTARAHSVTRQEAESAGAAVVFTKPFSPTQLLLEIRRLAPSDPESPPLPTPSPPAPTPESQAPPQPAARVEELRNPPLG